MTDTAPFDAAEDAVGDALDALAAISGVDTRAARNVLFTILETITGARATRPQTKSPAPHPLIQRRGTLNTSKRTTC